MPSLGGGTGEPHERAQMEEAWGNIRESLPPTPADLSLLDLSTYLKRSNKHSFI